MRTHALAAVAAMLCLCAATQGQIGQLVMDAANQDCNNVPFDGYVAVRPIIDNRKGTEPLTNVRFKVEVHSGILGNIIPWKWDDGSNPWFGARPDSGFVVDGVTYLCGGLVYYPPTQEWAPGWLVEYPGGEIDTIFDVVPAGVIWDLPVKMDGWLGSEINIFSTAEGTLSSDQLTATLYDGDPTPQTIPEPSGVCLLAIGALAATIRRRRRA